MQVHLCMTRGFQRLRGDMTFFLVTVFGNLVVSLVLGSVFYDLPSTAASMNSRCILLFFAILFNALSSALEAGNGASSMQSLANYCRFCLFTLNDLLWRSRLSIRSIIHSRKPYLQQFVTFQARSYQLLHSTSLSTSWPTFDKKQVHFSSSCSLDSPAPSLCR